MELQPYSKKSLEALIKCIEDCPDIEPCWTNELVFKLATQLLNCMEDLERSRTNI